MATNRLIEEQILLARAGNEAALEAVINQAWDDRAALSPSAAAPEVREAVEHVIGDLNAGHGIDGIRCLPERTAHGVEKFGRNFHRPDGHFRRISFHPHRQ